jgi:predicted phage terminase large subunit-like protein
MSETEVQTWGLPAFLSDYEDIQNYLDNASDRQWMEFMRMMAQDDLYFLLRFVLSTRDWKDPEREGYNFWEKQWLIDRCREIQFDSEDVINVWARFHCKSTIQTLGESVRAILKNPNITIGIFSVTKGVADEFVSQVKRELEQNELLKGLFPDRLYWDPQKESDRWTVEKGFVVKRSLNLKDASVRGFGLLDTSFTGHRISKALYDDAVNESNGNTPDMIEKTNSRWELSLATGMPGSIRSTIGTFYAHGDTYHHMAGRGMTLRLHPCFEINEKTSQYDESTGLPLKLEHHRDKPVLFSRDYLEALEKTMGKGTFGIQLLCDPNAGSLTGFKTEWLRFYEVAPGNLKRECNTIITVDPAGEKKKDSSYTAMWVWGLGKDKNYYILDGCIDRLNLHERTDKLFDLVSRWEPQQVRYEKYSMQGDIQHIQYVQERRNFRFNIIEVKGMLSKDDRIERLIPLFQEGRIYLPKNLLYMDTEGNTRDIIQEWINREYIVFPNTTFKDGLDSMSRVCEKDLPLPWPRHHEYGKKYDGWRDTLYGAKEAHSGGWMSS